MTTARQEPWPNFNNSGGYLDTGFTPSAATIIRRTQGDVDLGRFALIATGPETLCSKRKQRQIARVTLLTVIAVANRRRFPSELLGAFLKCYDLSPDITLKHD